MVHAISYFDYVMKAGEKRALMARIALNCLHDRNLYPLDISDLSDLSEVDKPVVFAFLDWCSYGENMTSKWGERRLPDLIALADSTVLKS